MFQIPLVTQPETATKIHPEKQIVTTLVTLCLDIIQHKAFQIIIYDIVIVSFRGFKFSAKTT